MAEVAENTPPLPSYYVIKNGVLIFRKKALRDGFLRTFGGGLRMCSQEVRRMEVMKL